MGNGESSEALREAPHVAAVRRTQPNERRTLEQLGIEMLADTSVLREHFVASKGVPASVAHRRIGVCQVVAQKTRGALGERTYYVVRSVNPLFAPGTDEQLSQEYYVVPERVWATGERLLHKRPLAIIEFRPYGTTPHASGVGVRQEGAGASATVSSYGSPVDGYMIMLNSYGVQFLIEWRDVRRLLTIHENDAKLRRKIEVLALPFVKSYADVHMFKIAVGETALHCPATSQFLNTVDSDAAAWGTTLDAPRTVYAHIIAPTAPASRA